MAEVPTLFSPSMGWGLIIGLGTAFAVIMSCLSWALSKHSGEVQDSEQFMTAKHQIRTGLTASAVVSSWTIASTLLTSTSYGFSYGVSGPFWYGAIACVQILLFVTLAIELKRKAPTAHTFLEVVKIRYGAAGHITLACYSMIFQFVTTVNLLVGGSSIYHAVTGMPSEAGCLLLPLGVMVYTLFGGIKATFLTDWVHTVVLYVIILMSLFVVYATGKKVGSPDRMYELLEQAAKLHPVEGNAQGSYLTMTSIQGGYIGAIFVGAGFAAAVDSELFQKAIAASPESTIGGYLLVGLAWFAIPFCLATTWGLAGAALESDPQWPGYPARMTPQQVSEGLGLPWAASVVMGKGGAAAILVMIFMAVTSCMSSEILATTALMTYDVYRSYVNPKATGKQLMRFSQWVIVGFSLITGCVAIGLIHAGFTTSYIITAIGIVVDSAVVPMSCTILWKRQSKPAVILAPIMGTICGLGSWLGYTYHAYGALTITTTSQNLPLVIGNMVSFTSPMVFTPFLTLFYPQNYDWELFKKIEVADDSEVDANLTRHIKQHERDPTVDVVEVEGADSQKQDDKMLIRGRNIATAAAIFMTLAFCVLWPIPMYASQYVFSKPFFRGWIAFTFIWALWAAIVVTLLPLWEGRHAIVSFIKSVSGSVAGTQIKRRDSDGDLGSSNESSSGDEKSGMKTA
ncbi:hypothetical protein JAAARDRAFT_167243 [Jaapia argillacea MUCL 33604]|uniref:Urea active transporter n=1 Tax=Jaapia argillacea MUCL 33604 TaxID=933084 RepID=A0A067QPY3_9AGAM|nr:hypothetical protein JAAARDRAFT_167243 [Jaapia argillacea MUCL 33604]